MKESQAVAKTSSLYEERYAVPFGEKVRQLGSLERRMEERQVGNHTKIRILTRLRRSLTQGNDDLSVSFETYRCL